MKIRLAAPLAAAALIAGTAAQISPAQALSADAVWVNVRISPAAAAAGASVTLWNTGLADGQAGRSFKLKPSQSDPTSYFLLTNEVRAGRHTITVSNWPTYPTQWYPGVFNAASSATVYLNKTSHLNCTDLLAPTKGCNEWVWNMSMKSLQPLTGYVRNRAGSPASGVAVTASRVDDAKSKYSAATNGSGYYSLNVPAGDYNVQAPNGAWYVSARRSVNTATRVDLTLNDSPSAPRNVVAAAGTGKVTATWAAPSDNGGLAVDSYTATASPSGKSCTTTGSSCTISGLTNNTAYRVSVKASNKVGTSPASSLSNAVTPLDPPPGAPVNVSATAEDRAVAVEWSAPTSGAAAVIDYTATASPSGRSCTTEAPGRSCTITGLTNGQPYTVAVTARTSGGSTSSPATDQVVPAGVPTAPRYPVATPADGAVNLTWDEPVSDNGRPLSGYRATATPGGATCTAPATAGPSGCTITGLTNGVEYSFEIQARNEIGWSDPADVVTATPQIRVPSAPQAVTAVASDGSAVVSWLPPTDMAGGIDGYQVTTLPAGPPCNTTELSCTITPLTNGMPVAFVVKAVKGSVSSPDSDPSAVVVPVGRPSAPSNVHATAGNGHATVKWDAPLDTGGVNLNTYTVTAFPGGMTCTATEPVRTCTIQGLTNGQPYVFAVVATNMENLSGDMSAASAQAVPYKPAIDEKPTPACVVPEDATRTTSASALKRATKGRTVRLRGVQAAYAELRFNRAGRKAVKVTSGGKTRRYVTKAKAITVGLPGLNSPGTLKVKTNGAKLRRLTTIRPGVRPPCAGAGRATVVKGADLRQRTFGRTVRLRGVQAAYAELRFNRAGRKAVKVTSGGKTRRYVTKAKAITVGLPGLSSPGTLKVKTAGGWVKRVTVIK